MMPHPAGRSYRHRLPSGKFDAIVIGSGMGGHAAAILAKNGEYTPASHGGSSLREFKPGDFHPSW